MKQTILIFAMLFFCGFAFSQDSESKKQKLPTVNVKTIDGENFSTSEITNVTEDGEAKPIIISFWASWCKPCLKELSAISEVYDYWVEETGVKLIAVSIDDARSSSNVKPLVDGNSWEFEVLLDANQEFKRAMNVNMIPHIFIINSKGEIVYQHTIYSPGAEEELIEMVRKLNNGEDISHD